MFHLAGGAALAGLPAWAAPPGAPPKPGNVLSPDAALERLMQGNTRYVEGLTRRHDFATERAVLAQGQNPLAGILSCADSRVAPEFAFDSYRGDLFVVRVAGNFVNEDNLASFEYAVAELSTPLLMVLGHGKCGAVAATIASLRDGTTLPGHLPSLVQQLRPAVEEAQSEPGDLLHNAIRDNVRLNVARLRDASPILSAAVAQRRLRVVGGVYDLATGRVDVITV
ncbi:carbonic anhydrase [Acidocella sp.]|uniref:carbonic anhydrase n=1 Tax=Acidocella sp. TaxID=50710 RepID=UPI002F406E66